MRSPPSSLDKRARAKTTQDHHHQNNRFRPTKSSFAGRRRRCVVPSSNNKSFCVATTSRRESDDESTRFFPKDLEKCNHHRRREKVVGTSSRKEEDQETNASKRKRSSSSSSSSHSSSAFKTASLVASSPALLMEFPERANSALETLDHQNTFNPAVSELSLDAFRLAAENPEATAVIALAALLVVPKAIEQIGKKIVLPVGALFILYGALLRIRTLSRHRRVGGCAPDGYRVRRDWSVSFTIESVYNHRVTIDGDF